MAAKRDPHACAAAEACIPSEVIRHRSTPPTGLLK
jgi:hypothetical protein